jgi:alpha-glucoside transport system substrate-binding protein
LEIVVGRRALWAVATAAALVVAGCASNNESASVAEPEPVSVQVVEAAREAASKAAEGKQLGGTINLLGLLSGPQLKQYLGTFKPFEEATGVKIKYESTGDLFAVLQTRLAGGNPPDAVSNPSAGQMRQLAEEGKLVALDEILDMGKVKEDYPAGLVDLATVDGKLHGIFYNTAVQSLVWYDPGSYDGPTAPATWTELSDWARAASEDGKTPWCVGLSSGPNSGWPGAAWIEQFVLKQSGADAFDRWWQGSLPWSSPEIRSAFEAFGAVATDPKMVSGGPTAVLTATFNQSPLGLYAKPPSCYLTVQADFLGNLLAQTVPGIKPGEDVAFFPFPTVQEENAGLIETSGEMIGLLKDTPQSRALMRYLATAEFGAMVAATGQWLGVNKKVRPDAYPSELSRKAAEVYAAADDVRYAAQASMPLAMETAFFKAVLDYVKHPDRLTAILAGLDRTRQTAYT